MYEVQTETSENGLTATVKSTDGWVLKIKKISLKIFQKKSDFR